MDKLNTAVESFDTTVKGWLSYVDNNDYITAALSLFLIVYASYAAPKLPGYILKLFDNVFFKILIFFLIVYAARKNPTVAIIAAVALMITIQALNKFKIDQMLMSFLHKEKIRAEGMAQLGEQEHDMNEMDEANMMMGEEMEQNNAYISDEAVLDIQEQTKMMPMDQMVNEKFDVTDATKSLGMQMQMPSKCIQKEKYRNNFYPQYVNMKPDAYLSRYTGNEVNGFDPNAAYSAI